MSVRLDQRKPNRSDHPERLCGVRVDRSGNSEGVPIDRVMQHYQCVRAGLKKGTRSDLHKMDKYFYNLFGR